MTNNSQRLTLPFIVVLILYLGMVGAVVWGMFTARNYAVREFNSPAAQQQWDQWRETVVQQADADAPVQRRVPKSAEPPTLRLLRDHFTVCLIGALIATSLLYFMTSFFVLGACGLLGTPGRPIQTR